jgi:hypothetical protein
MLSASEHCLREVAPDDWLALTDGFADHNYEQSLGYAASLVSGLGSSVRLYAVEDDVGVVCAALVRVKAMPVIGGVAYISSGPLLHPKGRRLDEARCIGAILALKRELVDRQRLALYFRLPIVPPVGPGIDSRLAELGFRTTERVRSYRTIAVDLTPDEAELRKRLGAKWRGHLRAAEKAEGITIESGSSLNLYERFLIVYSKMHDEKGFEERVDPRMLLDLPPSSIGLHVIVVSKEGQDIAGHVLSVLGSCAINLFGATTQLGRPTKAGYLLHWQAMLAAKQRDCTWYDSGGIDPESNPGVYAFKCSLGGHDLVALGPYETLPSGVSGALLNGFLGLRDRMVSR